MERRFSTLLTLGIETAGRIDVTSATTTKDGVEVFYKVWGSGIP
jgi:hypothetical protein